MIDLLIEGRLPIRADGQFDLPKEPPFDLITPGWAAVVTVDLDPDSPNCIRLFDAWFSSQNALDVIAFDGKSTRIRAAMLCVGLERHDGIQVSRAWSEPLRHANGVAPDGREGSLLYRPTPRFQAIAKPVHRYQIAAQRYVFVGPDLSGQVRQNGHGIDKAG